MLEEQLYSVLSPLVAGNVFPDTAPAETPRPYILYQQVGGIPVQFMEGDGSTVSPRMQITIWSDSRLQAAQLQRAAQRLLVGAPLFGTIAGGAVALHEDVLGLRGTQQDFYFKGDP
ncbi:DUF3168 domain-containing protein [Chromobacterium violaceum]|uniref:DUF3168 domain-containing protein n=1 Tax=Chromobacterium violaceum TaxID=536 RepID=UPI001E576CC8|nr:DUF3168 domain-containing protein [Chromobacterium violaceum]MCD0492338.1 DUF3168 domain-containing protein [Chromobacterium violaceum]